MVGGMTLLAASQIVHVSTSNGWTIAGVIVGAAAALATVLLAFVTRTMAKRTEEMAEQTKRVAEQTRDEAQAVTKQVEVANRQVEVASEALQASSRPWLTSVPYLVRSRETGIQDISGGIHLMGDRDGSFSGAVPLRNVGEGIAVIETKTSRVLGHPRVGEAFTEYAWLRTDTPVVKSGDESYVGFQDSTEHRVVGPHHGGLYREE
jgi:hypothetical protein